MIDPEEKRFKTLYFINNIIELFIIVVILFYWTVFHSEYIIKMITFIGIAVLLNYISIPYYRPEVARRKIKEIGKLYIDEPIEFEMHHKRILYPNMIITRYDSTYSNRNKIALFVGLPTTLSVISNFIWSIKITIDIVEWFEYNIKETGENIIWKGIKMSFTSY